MTPRRYQLEVFDIPTGPQQTIVVEPAAFETAKLEAYERGYAAGWDDALAERAEQDANARNALLQQLQDFAFTFHEARQAILRSVEPVLSAMTDSVLPGLLRDLMGDQVIEHLRAELVRHTDVPLRLRHHPGVGDLLRDVVAQQSGLSLELHPDSQLGQGRFVLERGDCEVELDLDRLCRDIRDRIQDHLSQVSERNPS